ncbi:hypothetical protein Raf01_78210 [Rugosimonospora africana]|uniref:Uncharacterized protein n=1 Tax=Rugosimonospora africana TaxID=556532 RepID=A0A8J3R0K2_9ACTN|nr:hypothetical protein Raf01_78210 [Rugosimonospora africana]
MSIRAALGHWVLLSTSCLMLVCTSWTLAKISSAVAVQVNGLAWVFWWAGPAQGQYPRSDPSWQLLTRCGV